MADKSGIKPHEVRLTQRDIRENTGFGHSWIKQNLRQLSDFEYIVRVRGGNERSKGFYSLRENEDIEKLDLSSIPSPEEIQRKMKLGTN